MNVEFIQDRAASHSHAYGARKFLYNNALLMIQASISLFLMGFCSAMLIMGREASIYLPVMTGCAGFWLPSPIAHKVTEIPSGIPQIRQMMSSNA